MSKIPQIRIVFILTKNDSSDFDRDAVTKSLNVVPSKMSEPILSKGKIGDIGVLVAEKELAGITILPAESPPYQMLLHAYWSIELPKVECWELDEQLKQMEQIFYRKEAEIRRVCKVYNLSADLIVRVFAESNNMPILTIENRSVSFWASMGATIDFDFYLD